jgi:hypothetical protein
VQGIYRPAIGRVLTHLGLHRPTSLPVLPGGARQAIRSIARQLQRQVEHVNRLLQARTCRIRAGRGGGQQTIGVTKHQCTSITMAWNNRACPPPPAEVKCMISGCAFSAPAHKLPQLPHQHVQALHCAHLVALFRKQCQACINRFFATPGTAWAWHAVAQLNHSHTGPCLAHTSTPSLHNGSSCIAGLMPASCKPMLGPVPALAKWQLGRQHGSTALHDFRLPILLCTPCNNNPFGSAHKPTPSSRAP